MSFLSPQEPRIGNVVEDTTPQLGGTLDVNNFNIIGTAGVGPENDGSGVTIIGGGAVSAQTLIQNQQQDRYTGVGDFGTFNGTATGTFYVVADVMFMADGSFITVNAVDGSGNITAFVVTTSGGTTITTGAPIAQISVAPANGQTGFTIAPQSGNVTGSSGGDLLLQPGSGAGGATGVNGDVLLGGTLNTNNYNITSPVKDGGAFHHINIFPGEANNDEKTANNVNITGGAVDYGSSAFATVAGDVNITGGGLVNANYSPTGGGVNIVGASVPTQVAANDDGYGFGGSVSIVGGTVPENAHAYGGDISLTAGDSYSYFGTSIGGGIHIKSGEGFDFPGDIVLEGGGSETTYGTAPVGGRDGGAVIIQASVYGGALGNYGGDQRTTSLRFQGLQSGTALSPSGRILDNYVALRAPDNVPVEYTLILPSAQPTVGQLLSASAPVSDLNGKDVSTLSWASPAGGGGVTNPMTANLDTGGYTIFGLDGVQGANVDIIAGASTSNYGGRVNITGGVSTGYSGGGVSITGGDVANTYAGGAVILEGGEATGSAGIGGRVNIFGGNGGNSGNGGGGDIRMRPGVGSGSTGVGAIIINHGVGTGPNVTLDKLYNISVRSTSERNLHWDGLDLTSDLRGLDALSNNPSFNFGTDVTLTGGDGYLGSGDAGVGGDIVLQVGVSRAPTSGTQEVDVGGTRVGGDVTGLTNDATVYTAAVVVDGGGSQPISIVGTAAQTYTTLLSELNADTTGAVWSLSGGNLLLTSDSTVVPSTIAITDTDLFLTLTTFVAVDAAVAGLAPSSGAIVIPDVTTVVTPTTNKLYSVAGALTWNGGVLQDGVVPATTNDFAALDASGNIIDGGAQASDFATAAQGTTADTAAQPADLVTPTATTAELTAIANAINTGALKVAGYMVFNTTTTAPVWAVGSADASVWNDATGTLAHTPV